MNAEDDAEFERFAGEITKVGSGAMCGRKASCMERVLLRIVKCPLLTYRLIILKALLFHLLDIFTDISYLLHVPFHHPILRALSILAMFLPLLLLLTPYSNIWQPRTRNRGRRLALYFTGYYALYRYDYEEEGRENGSGGDKLADEEYKKWYVRNDVAQNIFSELEFFFVWEDGL